MTHLLEPIVERAAESPRAVAIRRWSGGRRPRARTEVTYADLVRRIEATARGLRARGLSSGDRALFSVRPRPAGVVLALGTVRAGGTVVFVDPGAAPELFTARVAAAAPRWAMAESLLYAVSRGPLRRIARARGLLLPDYASLPLRHVHAGARWPGVPRGSTAAARLAREPVARDLPPLGSLVDEPALVVFTSGTTAQPRAVMHTAASLGAGTDLLRKVFALAPGDVVHTDQMLLGVPALLAGATWSMPAVAPARDIAGFARGLDGAAGTYLVPADLTALLDGVEDGTIPARGPRTGLLGGAPVTRSLLERAARLLPATRWVVVYGMTEILPVAVVDGTEKLAWTGDGDLVGAALPGTSVRVDRGEGSGPDEPATGEAGPGELVVSGPSLMAGYLHDLDGSTPGSAAGGRAVEHRTGDLARIDDRGRIVLVGRTRDMIIRGTTNIYPGLFEPRLAALPGVGEAALVGIAQDDGDERVALVVAPDATARAGAAAAPPPGTVSREHPLVAAVSAALPEVLDHDAQPDVVVVVDRLPVSGRSRKPDRAALARLVAAQVVS